MISVIMPNYNKAQFLEWAIRSVLNQSYDEFELVIVDDGSSDSSVSIIEDQIAKDGRIRLIEHDRNRGLPKALNDGIVASRSSNVTFMGSDDLFSPDRLKILAEKLGSLSEPSAIYSDLIYMGPESTEVSSVIHAVGSRPSGMILSYLLSGAFRFHGGPLTVPKSFFDAVGGYDESLSWGEDFEMSLRLAEKYPFAYDSVATYGYRIYGGNTINRITTKFRWGIQAKILEQYLVRNRSVLDSESERRAFDYLLSCYVASRAWPKLLRWGFSDAVALWSLSTLPKRVYDGWRLERAKSSRTPARQVQQVPK